ncbi:hypothetical protein BWI15_35210 [Kribbella sp. ALI-6-A]|nr:hypothetical protein BWI15_35210 [Kribbella sp. ALI-6-A]
MPRRKFGNIPDGGGDTWARNKAGSTPSAPPGPRTGYTAKRHANIGTAHVHTVIDDHSRLAYVEICADETGGTAIGVLRRVVAWYADHGITVERVLSDNGPAYKPHAWRNTAQNSASPRNEAGPKPTAKSRDFTAPRPTAARRPLSPLRNPTPNGPPRAASTCTITTDPTAPSEANHPSPDSPTSLDSTASPFHWPLDCPASTTHVKSASRPYGIEQARHLACAARPGFAALRRRRRWRRVNLRAETASLSPWLDFGVCGRSGPSDPPYRTS